MRDYRTRVLLVRFTSDRDPLQPRLQSEQICFAVVVLYPPEIKRQLVTMKAAEAPAPSSWLAKSSSVIVTGRPTWTLWPAASR